MTFDQMKGSAKELKGKIKQAWAKLTDDDLKYVEGNVDELVGRIQKAYGEKKEDIMAKIDRFKASHLDRDSDTDADEMDEVQKSYRAMSDKDQRDSTRNARTSDREL